MGMEIMLEKPQQTQLMWMQVESRATCGCVRVCLTLVWQILALTLF